MITKTINLYTFDELSEEAQQSAIEAYRCTQCIDPELAIDNCYLFELSEEAKQPLFGDKYDKKILIKNTREKIYFSTDRNWFLSCHEAMKVTNDEDFLKWLGLEEVDNNHIIDYTIHTPDGRNHSTTIDITVELSDDTTEVEAIEIDQKIENAIIKFDEHIKSALHRIRDEIEYMSSDEAIAETINANDYTFTIEGKEFDL